MVAQQRPGLVLRHHLYRGPRRPGDHRSRTFQPGATHRRTGLDQLGPVFAILEFWGWRRREPAVSIPAVSALHRCDHVVGPKGSPDPRHPTRWGRVRARTSWRTRTRIPTPRSGPEAQDGAGFSSPICWCWSGNFRLLPVCPIRGRIQCLQRTTAPEPASPDHLGRPCGLTGVQEQTAAELAIRIPGCRLHGGAVHLPAPPWISGIQTRRIST